MHTVKKIAVIGAGAIGSVVAGYLTKAGKEVVLIGKENQVKAIETRGLRIKGARGEETVKMKAATQLQEACDLAVFTTKTQDLQAAYEHNKESLRDSIVLSSQNGVQSDTILRHYFDEQRHLSSIVMFGATYVEPGKVTFNFEGDWIIGKPYGEDSNITAEVADVLKAAFPAVISEDIVGMKWLKLFVNFNNCIPALVGKSMQETFADLDLCKLSVLLLKEGVGVVKACGITPVSLPQFPVERILGLAAMPLDQGAGIINKTLTTLSKEPLYGSILQSIMRGKTSEIDYINGEVLRLAREHGEHAPLNERVVGLVHEVETKGEYFSSEQIKEVFQPLVLNR